MRAPRVSRSPASTGVPTGWSASVESTTSPACTQSFSGSVTSTASAPAFSQIRNERVDLLLAARAGGAERVAGDEHADDVQLVVVPVVAGHLAARRVQPGQVLGPAVDRRPPLEPVPLPQRRVLAPQPERGLGDLVDVEPRVVGRQSTHEISLSWQ